MSCKRKSPYIWVTWLSKIMAGEQACLWSSWFRAHHQNFQKAESDFDLARWNLEHTRLLVRTRTEFGGRHAEVRIEGQNSFQYRHVSGAVVAGKPDIVAVDGMNVVVIDCKTGKPRTADQMQVQIYMHVLPICFPELSLATISGRLVYPNRQVDVEPRFIDSSFAEHLDYFINLIASDQEPFKAPSIGECRFCDITASDCPVRVQSELKTIRA